MIRSGGQAEIQSPIMQPASGFHDAIFKSFAKVAINGMDDAKNLNTAKAMLDANALPGYLLVALFLLCSQFLSFWFLHWLVRDRYFWLIVLEPQVFPDLAAFVKGERLFFSQRFVMLFAFTGGAQHFHLLGGLFGDHVILERMTFFLAAVVLFLPGFVLRTPNGTFGPVNDKLQSRAHLQHLFYILSLAGWQLFFVSQGTIQNRRQAMNPVPCLNPKQVALNFLERIDFEIEQDEQQFVFHPLQGAIAPTTTFPLALRGSRLITPIQIGFICPLKCWQQLLKRHQVQTRKASKHHRFVLVYLVCNHVYLPIWIWADYTKSSYSR